MHPSPESAAPLLAVGLAALLFCGLAMAGVRRREARRARELLAAGDPEALLNRLIAAIGLDPKSARRGARWSLRGFLEALDLPPDQRRFHERFGQTLAAVGAIHCRQTRFADGQVVLDLEGPADRLLHTLNCVMLARHVVFLAFACVADAQACVFQCFTEPTEKCPEPVCLFSLRATRAKARFVDPIRAHNAQLLKVFEARVATDSDDGVMAVLPHVTPDH